MPCHNWAVVGSSRANAAAAIKRWIPASCSILTRYADCADLQVAGFNYQLAYSSQNPVTELPPSEAGFYDVFGSAWEWAEDHFAALPGECNLSCS